MNYIADLHIHSRYSRATSKASNLYGLAAWAAVKGIGVVGTGDFTHPGWFAHLHDCLEPAEPGFFRLKPSDCDYGGLLPPGLKPAVAPETVRFVLSAEISSIYKRGGKVRKVHNLLYVPDFEAVRRLHTTLATLGNITADGRPILGLDSRDLLEILLEKAPDGFLVPAHIWTPWFSLFGSKSGFDRIEECFGDLSDHIFALETGLSSDPEMNRLISGLDRFTLFSNSDCHSPAKLGREANLFATGFDFFSLREALRSPLNAAGEQVFAATIEFYPEEGKYHCDGHRKCQICLEPQETRRLAGFCPSCGKSLTIGVLHRVMELADRQTPVYPPGSPAVHSLIPLQEIIAELLDCGPASKKAVEGYVRLINTFGSEFNLLLETPVEEIRAKNGELLAEAIERVRSKRVIRRAGFDGEFGVITVFSRGEKESLLGQANLFGPVHSRARSKTRTRTLLNVTDVPERQKEHAPSQVLNGEQQRAVTSEAPLLLVQAGPGTGKTHTLVSRVRRMAAQAEQPCTVITFTNKAADEVRERLGDLAAAGGVVTVATFHGYCLAQLRCFAPGLRVVGPDERVALLASLYPAWPARQREELSRQLTLAGCHPEATINADGAHYLQGLDAETLVDLDMLVPRTVALLRQGGEGALAVRAATGHLFVDEFQDVNGAQYALVTELAATCSVFAIGDPDQAIYGFRGSDPRWFHTFIHDHQPEVHRLVCNYRSGARILRGAEVLIGHNDHPLPVSPMQPHSMHAGTLHRHECSTPEQEAVFIAEQIEYQLGGTSHRSLERISPTFDATVTLRDIGVLSRTGRQAEVVARELARRGIPFQLVDLAAYYTKGDCRPLYVWMLLLAGLADPGELLTLLAYEQGCGEPAGRGLYELLRQVDLGGDAGLSRLAAALAAIDLPGLAGLRARLARLRVMACERPVVEVLATLTDLYGFDPQEPDLVRLRELALMFDSLPAFAAHLHHFSESVLYDRRAEAVTLSTLHAAKGLEFAVVFLAGLEEGLVPLAPRQALAPEADREHLEEERRLLYVGMTRAIAILYLTWCQSRSFYGGPAEPRQPSRYLAELPADLFSAVPSPRQGKRQPSHRQLSLFS